MKARNVGGGLSEAAFQAQVLGLAAFYGWRTYHPPDNRPATTRGGHVARQRVTRGFPDLVLVRGPELMFVELKAEAGRLGPGQAEWIEALEEVALAVEALATGAVAPGRRDDLVAVRVEVHLWRPSDWDALSARLAAGRGLVAHPLGA